MEGVIKKLESFEEPSTLLWRGIELKIVKSILEKYPQNGKSLDLGCGEGRVARATFTKQISVGLDSDPEMVKKAKLSHFYGKVVLGDACKLPFPDKHFDFIFSNSVVEHIENIGDVLSELRRIIKIDGIIVITVPNNRLTKRNIFSSIGLYTFANWYGQARNKKFNHYNLWSITSWRQELKKKGLKIIDTHFYLNKKETEQWDALLIIFWIAKKINLNLAKSIYKVFRKKIWNIIIEAKETKTGSASCIVIGHAPKMRL